MTHSTERMKTLNQFSQILIFLFLLSSCKATINKNNDIINSEEKFEENKSERKMIEIKFSCGENGISEYIEDGWIIVKEDSQEKICTWKSVPATKDCDMKKDKGCRITKPDKVGEEKIYLLEK